MKTPTEWPVWGVVAEFASADALVDAAERTRDAGYRAIDAYSPFAVPALPDALGFPPTHLPRFVFACGLAGAVGGMWLEYWTRAIARPLDVGGRPLFSWPFFLPVAIELTMLAAGLGATFGMLALNRLPQPFHPLFRLRRFGRASQDGFFLSIEASDPHFDVARTTAFLRTLQPMEVTTIAP